MRRLSLGFVAGVALLQQQAELPDWRWAAYALLLSVVNAALLLAWQGLFPRWKIYMRLLLSMGAAAVAGFFWAALLAQSALRSELHPLDEGRTLHVVGIVDSLPYQSEQGVRFNFRIERVLDGTLHPVPQHVALGWYSNPGQHQPAPATIAPGQRWQLSLRLQRPHGNANPFGFDYEVWLLEQGLRASGYVVNGDTHVLLTPFVACLSCVIEVARARLRSHIQTVLAGRRYAGVIVALVLGDQRGISQADWQVYTRTGISHLISITCL